MTLDNMSVDTNILCYISFLFMHPWYMHFFCTCNSRLLYMYREELSMVMLFSPCYSVCQTVIVVGAACLHLYFSPLLFSDSVLHFTTFFTLDNCLTEYRVRIGIFNSRVRCKFLRGGCSLNKSFGKLYVYGELLFSIAGCLLIYYCILSLMLIQLSGDVHPNPGPVMNWKTKSFTFCHVNARSICSNNKLDDLLS
jgi:hypothetical protein